MSRPVRTKPRKRMRDFPRQYGRKLYQRPSEFRSETVLRMLYKAGAPGYPQYLWEYIHADDNN